MRRKQIDSAQSLQCFTGQSALWVAATFARATFCSGTALSAMTSGPWKMPLLPARCLASLGFVFFILPPFFYLTSPSECFILSTNKCLVCLALLRPYDHLPIPGNKGDSTVNFWRDAQYQLHNGQGDFQVLHQFILYDFKIQLSFYS